MRNFLLSFFLCLFAHAEHAVTPPVKTPPKEAATADISESKNPRLKIHSPREFGDQLFAVHNMKEIYFKQVEEYVKKNQKLDPTWPWKGSYPGLWTAWRPKEKELKTIDGELEKITYPGGEKGAVLRLGISEKTKILLLTDYDLSAEDKAELARYKKRDSTTAEKWKSYKHLRKELIRLAAEAGYDAIYMPDTKELLLLDMNCVEQVDVRENGNWRAVLPHKK